MEGQKCRHPHRIAAPMLCFSRSLSVLWRPPPSVHCPPSTSTADICARPSVVEPPTPHRMETILRHWLRQIRGQHVQQAEEHLRLLVVLRDLFFFTALASLEKVWMGNFSKNQTPRPRAAPLGALQPIAALILLERGGGYPRQQHQRDAPSRREPGRCRKPAGR